jgi:hypothetical protein
LQPRRVERGDGLLLIAKVECAKQLNVQHG